MSIPLVITTSTRMVMDVSDYVMIKWVGSDAQAALLPAELLMWSFIVPWMGIVSMVNTLVAQSLGRGRPRDCPAYAWQGLHLSILFGLLAFPFWPLMPRIIAWIGHNPGIQAMERAYCEVAVWTVGPSLAGAALSGFFNGIHRPMITMWSALEALAVNAAASFLLIYGIGGLPRLGVAGAAWGTMIACVYRALRLLLAMCAAEYDRTYASRETWRPDRAKMSSILRVGVPTGLQWLSDVVVWTVFVNVLVGRFFGKWHLVASNIAWQYLRVGFMPCIGVGMALTSLVGKAIGRGRPDRAVRVTRIAVIMTTVYMTAFSLAYLIAGRWLISLLSDEAEVIRIGSALMVCAAIFQFFDALGITYNSALRGAGDTFWPSMLFVVSHWLILVAGGYAMAKLAPEWGSVGPWVVASLFLILIGVALWWRWRSRRWMSIDLFKHEAAAEVGGRNPEVGTQTVDAAAQA